MPEPVMWCPECERPIQCEDSEEAPAVDGGIPHQWRCGLGHHGEDCEQSFELIDLIGELHGLMPYAVHHANCVDWENLFSCKCELFQRFHRIKPGWHEEEDLVINA